MEPVTHFLTGACIGRAGFNRRTAYATLAATLAAEAPDMDIFWGFAGPVTALAHHRGITHTLIAAPFAALIITGLVWLLDRIFARSRRKPIPEHKPAPQPIRWPWVWLAAFVAHLSHLLLDWTNNYGIRPFFPFNKHWYSGDLVFIGEPVIWALLLLALVVPALLGLADREVGARRTQFRGRGWAIFALTGMAVLWCWRWAEHAHARNLVEASNVAPTPILRIALEPYPTIPWRWHAILETATTWQTAEVDSRRNQVLSDPEINALLKPTPTPASEFARRTYLGQVYQDWSTWPVIRDLGRQSVPGQPPPDFPPTRPWTAVEFSDLRFAYATLDTSMAAGPERSLEHLIQQSGLSGWVYVVDSREEAGQFLNGKEQK
jgi:inner membrane protein